MAFELLDERWPSRNVVSNPANRCPNQPSVEPHCHPASELLRMNGWRVNTALPGAVTEMPRTAGLRTCPDEEPSHELGVHVWIEAAPRHRFGRPAAD